jgi:hypothetical protein
VVCVCTLTRNGWGQNGSSGVPGGVPGTVYLIHAAIKSRVSGSGLVITRVNARPDCTLRDAAASSIPGSTANPVEYPTRNARRLVSRGMRSAQRTRLSRRRLPPGAVRQDRVPDTGGECSRPRSLERTYLTPSRQARQEERNAAVTPVTPRAPPVSLSP